MLEYSPLSLIVIVLVGAITAFFAATSGLVQNDIKRIVAFSTISQLGYMVAAIGLPAAAPCSEDLELTAGQMERVLIA